MKTLSLGIFLCLFSAHVYASGGRLVNDTSLIDINQNLLFRPELTSFQSAPSYKTASVHFVVSKDNKLGFEYTEPNFQMKTTDQCKTLGFEKTESCGANEYKAHTCPWDETRYDYCCDLNYSYTVGQCSYPRILSSDSCGGKFKCYCDRVLYPETSCSAPYIPSDDKCTDTTFVGGIPTGGLHYAACVCPDNWVQCDSSIHQKGNGTACTYRGKTTYESCGCEGGYTQTCDDFGPRTPSDYCFLKGTKYYKDCKTGNEICEGLGFKHSTSNPCSDDETIGDYCPKDGTYYSCKIDPVKYCKNHGYSNVGCAKYETVSSDVCPHDNSYKKCIPTCKSRIAGTGSYTEIDEYRWYNGAALLVWDDILDIDSKLKNPQGYEYGTVIGPRAFNYSECADYWKKPNLTIKADSNSMLLQKDLNNIKVTIDHKGTPSGKSTALIASGKWYDVDITETNAEGMGTDIVSYGTDTGVTVLSHVKNDTGINVYGDLYLNGNNTFTRGTREKQVNTGTYAQHLGFFHLGLRDTGNVHIQSGKTTFRGVPILAYEAKGSFNVKSASLEHGEAGFGIKEGQAKLNIDDAQVTLGSIFMKGDDNFYDNFFITGGSKVHVINGIHLYSSGLVIKGYSTVTQGDENIFVWNKCKICVATQSKLCSSGEKRCVTGAKSYYAEPGKGKYDYQYVGFGVWYKSDMATFNSTCGSGNYW